MVMPVRCGVCNKSFEESDALQQHKTAKGHNFPATGYHSGKKGFRDQAHTILHSSKIASSPAGESKSSANIDCYCYPCSRPFKSREALLMHAQAKNHQVGTTAKAKGPAESLYRCDICGRCNFRSQDAVNDHKRDSKVHQTQKQHSAPPRTRSHLDVSLGDEICLQVQRVWAPTLGIFGQYDLRSFNYLASNTCGSDLKGTLWEGQKQQNIRLSDAKIHRLPTMGYSYDNGNAASWSSWEARIDSEARTNKSKTRQTTLAKESDSRDVMPAIPPFSTFRTADTEDLLAQDPPGPHSIPTLDQACGSVHDKALKHLGKGWSALSFYEQLTALNLLEHICHPISDLEKIGYQLRQKTSTDWVGEQKCTACKEPKQDILRHRILCTPYKGKESRSLHKNGPQVQPRDVSIQADQVDDILRSHKFSPIDKRRQKRYLGATWTPARDPRALKSPAVALDCEMVEVVGSGGLWREVVKISAVDFLSGETLLDTFVLPTAPVKRWKTDITGIDEHVMNEARAQGDTVEGWTQARAELWRHIDADTILVGQSLHHDLEVLGILHARIVDSAILAAKAIGLPQARIFGLKQMCKEMLNVNIQCLEGGIHDCVEDALASRELVLHFMYHPQEVQTWALSKRTEELEKETRSPRNRGATASRQDKGKGKAVAHHLSDFRDDDGDDDDDGEFEVWNWADVAESLGYPHPDTGYDPWSD